MSTSEQIEPVLNVIIRIPLHNITNSPVNGRRNVPFDAGKNKALLDDIKRHGQKTPVIVRKLPDDSYELIAGTRRLGALRELSKDNPDLMLLAYVVKADLRESWRIAYAENTARKDLTPLQTARAWQFALDNFCGGVQEELAKAVQKDAATVSRTLALLDIPQEVLAVLRDPEAVSVNFAAQLVPLLAQRRAEFVEEAKRLSDNGTLLSGPRLLEHLLRSPNARVARNRLELPFRSRPRQAVLCHDGMGGATLSIKPLDATASDKERRALLRQIEGALKPILGLEGSPAPTG